MSRAIKKPGPYGPFPKVKLSFSPTEVRKNLEGATQDNHFYAYLIEALDYIEHLEKEAK